MSKIPAGTGMLPGPAAEAGGKPASGARGASSSSQRPPRGGGSSRTKRIPSIHEVVGGVRRENGFPVTRDELFELGGMSLGATICFSIGGTLINRSFDIEKDLQLNQGIPKDIVITWQTREADYWNGGLIIFALGIMLAIGGGLKIFSIIKSTEHPND